MSCFVPLCKMTQYANLLIKHTSYTHNLYLNKRKSTKSTKTLPNLIIIIIINIFNYKTKPSLIIFFQKRVKDLPLSSSSLTIFWKKIVEWMFYFLTKNLWNNQISWSIETASRLCRLYQPTASTSSLQIRHILHDTDREMAGLLWVMIAMSGSSPHFRRCIDSWNQTVFISHSMDGIR